MPHIAVNAQLLSPEPGYQQAGVSRYIGELLCGMWDVRPDVRWTVYCRPGVVRASFPGRPPASVRLRRSWLPMRKPSMRVAWEQLALPALLRRHRPDVLLAPLNVMPILAGCRTVVVVHDLAFLRMRTHRSGRRNYLAHMTRLSVRRASHVVTVSEFTRREVIELLGAPASKVTAIPNGLGSQFAPRPTEQLDAFRERTNLPKQYLLFVGTLEPRKNLAGLFQAYAAAREQIGMPLVVVGAKGWMTDPIFETVRQLKLGDHVRFEGFVSDAELPLYYAAATALAYPSLYEGFGLPPLEGMASGVPVVTSTGSSLVEVVGEAALLVAPGDTVGLSRALVRVATDADLRQQLRAAGLQQASAFSWRRTATTTLGVLLEQVERPSLPVRRLPVPLRNDNPVVRPMNCDPSAKNTALL